MMSHDSPKPFIHANLLQLLFRAPCGHLFVSSIAMNSEQNTSQYLQKENSTFECNYWEI